MKKKLAIVLAMALTVTGVFVGCGKDEKKNNDSAKNQKEVKFEDTQDSIWNLQRKCVRDWIWNLLRSQSHGIPKMQLLALERLTVFGMDLR